MAGTVRITMTGAPGTIVITIIIDGITIVATTIATIIITAMAPADWGRFMGRVQVTTLSWRP
jgi:hypothetical protein